MMELHDIVVREACASDIKERTKEAALGRIAAIAAHIPAVAHLSEEEIYTKLMEREAQGSTGFGNGVAIPHARLATLDQFVLFIVTSRRGVEFRAIDRKRVNALFVLLGPDQKVNEYLKVLAAVSHVINSTAVRRELLGAHTGQAVAETFLRNVHLATGERRKTQKMTALFVVLYIDEFFYDILEFLIQQGIEGATVIESSGMGRYISNIPLFASFIGFMNEDKNRSRTIVALVPEDDVRHVIDGIEAITGDLDKKEGAMIFTIDVGYHRGTMKMM
jgi:PTS system nitrogen regulatory IIA component